MILIEKYTGWWEDECQVHFVRRSHLDGYVGLGSSQLCGFWLPQIVSRREKDFRCCEVDWKESTFRAERAAGGERSRCFQQLYEYFFGVELSGGVLAASFPSPTWFCSTLLCNMFCILHRARKKGTHVNYFVEFMKKRTLHGINQVIIRSTCLCVAFFHNQLWSFKMHIFHNSWKALRFCLNQHN